MKNKLAIFFSISLIIVSGFCLGIFFKNKNRQELYVCNSITGKIRTVDVVANQTYSNIVYNSSVEGYEFEGYYYDEYLSQKIDENSTILPGITVYEGFIQNVTSESQLDSRAVGVNYVGEIDSTKLSELTEYEKVKIKTSSALYFENMKNVEELCIDGAAVVSGINNFSSIKTVELKNVERIENCFNGCNNLSKILAAEATIISNSFCDCKVLDCFEIDQSTTNIANSFFRTPIEKMSSQNSKYVVQNNMLFEIDGDKKTIVKASNTIENILIDTNVTKIEKYAFYDCKNLQRANLSARISLIEKSAFENSGIKSLNLQSNYAILTIEENAFAGTKNLESVNFGQLLSVIKNGAFKNSKIKQLDFSECSILSAIGDYAFANNKNLTKVVMNNSQISLNNGVFYNCENLETIQNLCVQTIAPESFYGCKNLETISGEKTITKIGSKAFYDCEKLADLEIFENVEFVEQSAFEKCVAIENINFQKTKTIKEKAFSLCTGLMIANIGSNVEEIDFSAFDGCESIQDIVFTSTNYTKQNGAVFTDGMQTICYYLPNYNAQTFVVPASVTKIENRYLSAAKNIKEFESNSTNFVAENGVLFDVSNQKVLVCYPQAKEGAEFEISAGAVTIKTEAFIGCPNLKTLKIGSGVQTIKNNALCKMQALSTLELSSIENASFESTGFLGWMFGAQKYEENNLFVPKTLKKVTVTDQTDFEKGCFYYCENLLEVSIAQAEELKIFMFTGCSNLQKLTLGTIKKIGMFALYDCKNLLEIKIGYFANIQIDSSALLNMSYSPTVYVSGMTDISTQFVSYREKFAKSSWVWRTL